MPRIRSIKPEFWSDEKLAPLDARTRLVFVGLWCMADDAGRLVDNLKMIDAFIFPATSESSARALAKLADLGRIVRGRSASGQQIIQLVNWFHQKIDKPNWHACLPEIEGFSPPRRRRIAEESANARRTVDDQSATPPRRVADESPTHSTTDQYQYQDLGSVSTIPYPDLPRAGARGAGDHGNASQRRKPEAHRRRQSAKVNLVELARQSVAEPAPDAPAQPDAP